MQALGVIYAEHVENAMFLNVARSFAHKDPMKTEDYGGNV